MMSKKFGIIGGGIGGLTLGIALQRRGFDVTVYEGAPVIRPLGAGLMLAANAVKALTEIGIVDEVVRVGKVMRSVIIKDDTGSILAQTDSEKLSLKFGLINNFTIHRADLHQVLIALLTPGTLQLGKACTDFVQKTRGVDLQFADGSSAACDYAIACDGIHSVVRQKLLPRSKPRYAGYTCWRAVIDDLPENLNIDETTETWGRGSRFGIAPLAGGRLYWFACLNARANDPVMRSYGIPALLKHFGKFHSPVADILKKTPDEKLIWSDINDLKPIKKFAFGNIALLGDAAHATTPNMGQGGCMAIEDAAVLANCLEHYETPEEAFRKYERKRIARTTKIVTTSRAVGRIAQWENAWLAKIRNAALRMTPASVTEKQIKFLTDVSFL